MKCPNCSFSYEGAPQKCPSCGWELRRPDPARCEFCGTRTATTRDRCPSCGAPLAGSTDTGTAPRHQASHTGSGTPGAPPSGQHSCLLPAIVVSTTLVIGGALLALSFMTSRDSDPETRAPEVSAPLIQNAMAPDSIHRGVIEEGRNTVESIWPRVLTHMPDSCFYPGPYDPCAAFRFTLEGRRTLARIEASAPIDLVLTLLREDGGVLSFAGWNEDGRPGSSDPLLLVPLDAGTYVALVTSYGGWAYGEVRFLWSVAMPEIPLVTSDTTLRARLSSQVPKAVFELDILQGRTYSIRTASLVSNMDSFIELRTEGGSILTDDDSGRNDFCWGDANLSFTAGPLQQGLASVTVRPLNLYGSTFGDLDVIFTITD